MCQEAAGTGSSGRALERAPSAGPELQIGVPRRPRGSEAGGAACGGSRGPGEGEMA